MMDNEIVDEEQELHVETVAAYWSHRGYVGMSLSHKIMDTLERGEIIDDSNMQQPFQHQVLASGFRFHFHCS